MLGPLLFSRFEVDLGEFLGDGLVLGGCDGDILLSQDVGLGAYFGLEDGFRDETEVAESV